jgi:hypothetical protein
MIRNRQDLIERPELQLNVQTDGDGAEAQKDGTWRQVLRDAGTTFAGKHHEQGPYPHLRQLPVATLRQPRVPTTAQRWSSPWERWDSPADPNLALSRNDQIRLLLRS